MMNPYSHIYLIGYRCTGKTTIGKALANTLGYAFRDTDEMVQDLAGQTIARIVSDHGWDRFRMLEKDALRRTHNTRPCVVSTGGGIILSAGNRAFLKRYGYCIWLTAHARTIVRRLKKDENTSHLRPALSHLSLEEETEIILAERGPLYEKTHHIKLETDHLSAQECVRYINRRIRNGRF